MPAATEWLLWSNQNRAFWRWDLAGFTHDLTEAARLSFADASKICFEAAMLDEPLADIDGHEMPHAVMMAAPEETTDEG